MLEANSRPISPLGENRKSRRKRQFATKNTKSTLKQKPLSLGAIMALENLRRMFEDKNENI